MSNCEISCLICGNPGLFKVNHSGFHKVCQDHINTELSHSQCIICKSEVSIIYEFLKCGKCLESEARFVCNCGVSLCIYCLKVCGCCNQNRCSDCISQHENKPKCNKCLKKEEKKSSISLTLGKNRSAQHGLCENCRNQGIINKKSNCEHKVCRKCQDAPCNTCKLSRTIVSGGKRKKTGCCEICKKVGMELNPYKKLLICENCKKSHIKNDLIDHCDNCAEPVDKTFLNNEYFRECVHTGCPKCSKVNAVCYKCLNKEKPNNDLLQREKCFFCQNYNYCFNLLCDHQCCISCMKEFNLAKLNYMCTECIMTTNKYCLSCLNPCLWIIEENKYLVKECCQKYKVCKFCLGKIGLLWHTCKMKKNLK